MEQTFLVEYHDRIKIMAEEILKDSEMQLYHYIGDIGEDNYLSIGVSGNFIDIATISNTKDLKHEIFKPIQTVEQVIKLLPDLLLEKLKDRLNQMIVKEINEGNVIEEYHEAE